MLQDYASELGGVPSFTIDQSFQKLPIPHCQLLISYATGLANVKLISDAHLSRLPMDPINSKTPQEPFIKAFLVYHSISDQKSNPKFNAKAISKTISFTA